MGLIIIDEKAKVQNINSKAVALLGYEKSHIIGNNFSHFLAEIDKDKFDSYCHPVDATSCKGTIELEMTTRNNKSIIVRLELIDLESSRQKYYIGIIKNEPKKKSINEEIEDLKDAKQEVFELLEEERELGELKSRFVSMASHEFRTPLAGVLSSLQLIKRYLDIEEDKWNEFVNKNKIETHFDKIEESVLNLNLILNDFLSLEKIEENKIDIKNNWFNLSSFIHEMCQKLKPICRLGQKIDYTHYGDNEEVYLDKHILRNIINNLISNAIKYSAENKTIHIISRKDASFLTIEIKDEGIGIPISEHKNIFRRFFRAGNAVNYQGTGLGLSIVKKYVELMNGNITFESHENQGTTFFVSFPKQYNE